MLPRELQQILLKRVRRRLLETLKLEFACVEDVTDLCCHQLKHTDLSLGVVAEILPEVPQDPQALEKWIVNTIEPIRERGAQSRYVADCERVAQFLQNDGNNKTQKKICEDYKQEYHDWLKKCLSCKLAYYLGESEAETRLAEAQSLLDDWVFGRDAFLTCASAYHSREGMRFENFFKRCIGWRCSDVARYLKKHPNIPKGMRPSGSTFDLDSIFVRGAQPSEHEDSPELAGVFRTCLACFRKKAGAKDAGLAALQIAVFELRYKGYLDPERMASETKRLAKISDTQLENEFRKCIEDLKDLEDRQLPEAEYGCDVAYDIFRGQQHELEMDGCHFGQIDRLQTEAAGRTQTDMESERKKLGRTDKDRKRHRELIYMISYQAYLTKMKKLEKLKVKWSKWAACRLPWIRSEKKIGIILGKSQPMASRYLNEINDFLQNCVKDKLASMNSF